MNKGPYKVINSKIVYKNKWIEVKEEKTVINGEEKIFGIIDNGSGVSIAAIDADRNILLVKEYYYAVEEYGIQLPSGGDDKLTALESAKNELAEETGYKANKWIDLGLVNPLTMILRSPAQLFLALELEQAVESEKDIEVIKLPLDEAYQMAIDSKITHAPSALAIIKAKIYLDANSS